MEQLGLPFKKEVELNTENKHVLSYYKKGFISFKYIKRWFKFYQNVDLSESEINKLMREL